MLGYLSKSGSFASAMVVYSHSVPSPTRALKRIMYERPCPKKDVGIINPWRKHINESLTPSRMFLNPRATIALAGPSQYRLAHTDIQIPDFDKYRRKSNIDPHKPAADTQIQRKMFTYVVGIAGIIPMVYGTKHFIRMFVGMLSPSAKVMAMAKVEIDIGDVPEGKNMTFVWRGKPLFVRHRPAEEIEREQQVDISQLRDKQTDQERAQKPEFLIVVGVCTHLGCVPIANAGEYGGYYCPCHGSHYDASGRIRKGPAPLNLEVPAYEYIDDTKVVVG